MTKTFTPGPWRWEPSSKTIRSIPANYWIATMDSWDGQVNNDANARLIAAAPALYEALKAVYDCFGLGLSPEQFVTQVSGFIDDARAALALVESEDA